MEISSDRPAPSMEPSDSLRMAQRAAEAALSRKALDVRILDLRGLASFTDYFVLCTGTSDTHLEGIASAILDKMKDEDYRLWHREGQRKAEWILLDYVDIVIHLFSRTAREFYGLERLWGEANPIPLENEEVPVDPQWQDADIQSDRLGEFTADEDEWTDDWDEEDE